jgi:sirohydrochlorin ferrochelatase
VRLIDATERPRNRFVSPRVGPAQGVAHMEFRPIDLPEVLAVVMGTSIVLIPVMAFAARYAFKPLVEALGRVWAAKEGADRIALLERRIALLERQVEVTNELAGLSAPFASPRTGISAD